MYNFTCVDASEGTVFILTGAAGADFSTNIQPTQPAWIDYVTAAVHGYVRARVTDRAVLTLDFVAAQTRTIVDSVSIHSKFGQAAEAVVASE